MCFVEQDRKWLEQLRKRLDFLEAQGALKSWDTTRIPAGRNCREEQQKALQTTKVAVVLLSADLLSSEDVMRDQLPPLLVAAQNGEVELLPVLARPCMYKWAPGLKELKPVNGDKPLAGLSVSEADAVLDQVGQQVLERLAPAAAAPAQPMAAAGPALTAGKARKAVILTALPVEYKAVRAHLDHLNEERHQSGTVYERGHFPKGGRQWEVGLVEIGAGDSRAAVEAERAAQFFTPEVMLFVGVAGGLKDVVIGDVVVATKVYGYESGKDTAEGFRVRPSVGETAYNLEQRARAEARSDDWLLRLDPRPAPEPSVYIGPIAAGEKVIAAERGPVAEFLRQHYGDALAVEMEGRGFLEAARANQKVSAIVIRGISDLLGGKASADAAGSQRLAARHASTFAYQVLAKL